MRKKLKDSKKRKKKPDTFIIEFKDLEKLENAVYGVDFHELHVRPVQFFQRDLCIWRLILDAIFTEFEYALGDRPMKLLLKKLPGCCSS